jgi:hypothetical protein
MPADVATGLATLAASASTRIAGGDQAVSSTATSAIATSADRCADGAPTPFYDQLMSMIHATALENRCAAQDDEVDTALRVGHCRWGIHPLVPGIAGFAVVATVCGVILVSETSQGQPPMGIAGAEKAREERSRTVDGTTTANEPAEGPVRKAGPYSAQSIGVEGMRTTEDGPEAGSAATAKSDERPLAISVAAQQIGNLGSTEEAGGHGAAVAPTSVQAMHTDPIASANPTIEQPLPADTPSSLPSAFETGSIKGASPLAIRFARVVSDVNMRARPSNGAAVVATISGGRPVEVIDCRQWCEVIFAGQRGWVYKSFIGASPIPAER